LPITKEAGYPNKRKAENVAASTKYDSVEEISSAVFNKGIK